MDSDQSEKSTKMRRLERVRPKYYKKPYMYMRDKYNSQEDVQSNEVKDQKEEIKSFS